MSSVSAHSVSNSPGALKAAVATSELDRPSSDTDKEADEVKFEAQSQPAVDAAASARDSHNTPAPQNKGTLLERTASQLTVEP